MKLLKLFLFCFALTLAMGVQAQNKRIEKVDKLFDAGEYYKAVEKYKKLYSKTKNKDDKAAVAFKTGLCYRAINQPDKAESWFKRAVKANYPDPKSVLYYAESLKKLESYDDALAEYQRYAEMVPDDPAGKIGVNSCTTTLEWIKKPAKIELNLLKTISSKNIDYSPAVAEADDKTIFFVSTRDGAMGNKFSNAAGANFSDIFSSTIDRKGDWSEPLPILGEVNTNYDEGPFCFTDSYSQLYFTRCEQKKNENAGCRIYSARRVGDAWVQVQEVELVNDSSITVAHPAISPDGQTLYFVSDMAGGKGGKDIWKAVMKGGGWAKPVNMGEPVNTPGDEMFPHVHPDGSLYFSSDYHAGMGGLDIFRFGPNKAGEVLVENLKAPINSAQDDFGVSFDSSGKKGFFSSTREATGKKADNLYSFELPEIKFSLDGIVVDEDTSRPIDAAEIVMTGSDGSSVKAFSKPDGKFSFKLAAETDYVLVSSKENYFKGKATESTKGYDESTVLNKRIEMKQIRKEVAFEVENIFYDLDKATLRPESTVALDKLVELLELNVNLQIELGSHTDFRGGDEYNQDLSQRRAQSVVNYLISKGIPAKRLVAVGYGETMPRKIDLKLHTQYPDFPIDTVLDEAYINLLPTEQAKDKAHQVNRRTDFKVLRTDYVINAETFGDE